MKDLISRPPARSGATIEKAMYGSAHRLVNRTEKMVYADDALVTQIVERGTAPVGTTTASGFASQLSQNLVGELVSTLAPLSAIATLMPQGLQVRMSSAASLKLPAREGAPSTTVKWVGEADPIPVRSYNLNQDCELLPKKFGFIVGVSAELAKRAGGESVVRTLIREDAAATLDASYFNSAAADADGHAGMLADVASVSGYAGGDREAAEKDLVALSDAVSAGGSGQLAFVVSAKRANRIKIKYPDLSRELTFLPSLAVGDTTIIALDPASWAHGFSDNFDIDVSEEAVVHMSDDPLPISASGVADPTRSYWQTNSVALRLLADVAFAARRPNAVAWAENVTW